MNKYILVKMLGVTEKAAAIISEYSTAHTAEAILYVEEA